MGRYVYIFVQCKSKNNSILEFTLSNSVFLKCKQHYSKSLRRNKDPNIRPERETVLLNGSSFIQRLKRNLPSLAALKMSPPQMLFNRCVQNWNRQHRPLPDPSKLRWWRFHRHLNAPPDELVSDFCAQIWLRTSSMCGSLTLPGRLDRWTGTFHAWRPELCDGRSACGANHAYRE